MNKAQISLIVFIALMLSSLCGCGYQLQGSGSVLPPDIQKVAIAQAENNTTEPGLGPLLTEAIRARFERYGVVRIVERPSEADAVLNSKVLGVTTDVRDVTGDTDIALELELTMTVFAELKKANGQVLWRDPALQVRESFASVSDVVVTSSASFAQGGVGADTLSALNSLEVSRGQKQEAFDTLTDEAARRIYLSAVAADF